MAASRRLAAIMFTDLSGYTSRTQRDESRTMRLLAEHRALVRSVLPRFGGREVKTMGDGFLVVFDSALNATLAAIELQRRSETWVRDSKEDRPRVRIALHVGDVLDDEGDVLGDAVNVASRIERVVEPGGICISGPVYEQVRNKIPCAFEPVPTPKLRGVETPLALYRVVANAESGIRAESRPPVARMAVLPFANISPDPKDEYFADGLTEELISGISQIRELRVIARTSVIPYKSTTKGVAQIGAELGVSTVLEGSVRKAGNRLRITAQLIDVESQEHLWAQTYDRELDDVFAVQGEIAHEVADRLKVTILEREERRVRSRPTGVMESYLAYLKGRSWLRGASLESAEEATRQFEVAIRLDSSNARAYSGLADAIYRSAQMSPKSLRFILGALDRARELALRSILADPGAAEAHASLGFFLDELYEFAPADRELRTAIELNPSYAPGHQWYARLLAERGRLEEAVDEYRLAEEADPLSPGVQYQLTALLWALGRPEEGERSLHRLGQLDPEGILVHLARFEKGLRANDPASLRAEWSWIVGHPPVANSESLRVFWTGMYRAATGDGPGARAEMERMRGIRDPDTDAVSEWAPARLAELAAQLGDRDECFRNLELAVATRSMPFDHVWLSQTFEGVRSDGRFRAVLQRVGLSS